MMGNLRLLEFLAIGIQEDAEHPLKASYINQFIPDPQEKFALPFCYTDSIVVPTRILQNLGIDIFADHRYDTWVIQAMKVRIEASVIPLAHHSKEHLVTWNSAYYTLFNRNNEPSVDMELAPKRTAAEVAIVVRACRTIKKGEELTYYNEGELNEAIHAISHQREKERTGCDFYRFLRNGISWDVPLPQYIVEGEG